MTEELLASYDQLDADARLRLLLVAAEDWAQETSDKRLRQELLSAVDEMHVSMLAVFPYQPDATEADLRQALSGMLVLGGGDQLGRLKGPLAANWARHAVKRGEDRRVLERMLVTITPASAAALQRMADHLGRPRVSLPRTRRI